MFGFEQRTRLLREEQWTANGLSQELFAMFGPDVPNTTEAPVQVTLPEGSTQAPIQIGNMTTGSTIFNVTHTDGSDLGSIVFDPTNGIMFQPPGASSPQLIGGSGGGGGVPVWG